MTVAKFLTELADILDEGRMYDPKITAKSCRGFAMIALNNEEQNQDRHYVSCEREKRVAKKAKKASK